MGDRLLVDHARQRLAAVTGSIAVNVHHGRDQVEAHLAADPAPGLHLSFEEDEARGTAGAMGLLRPWIDGRPALVTNADAWLPVDLGPFVAGWDGERTRLLCVEDPARGDFGPLRYCGVALMPWSAVAPLGPEPSGLYERSWVPSEAAGSLDLVVHDGAFIDCGTAADYLAANLAWSAGEAVVGEGADVAATAQVVRSVVWPHSRVGPDERLVGAVRAGTLTVLIR